MPAGSSFGGRGRCVQTTMATLSLLSCPLKDGKVCTLKVAGLCISYSLAQRSAAPALLQAFATVPKEVTSGACPKEGRARSSDNDAPEPSWMAKGS